MDDAYEVLDSELRAGTRNLKMGVTAGANYLGGLVFRDVRVPPRAQITSAQLKLWPWGWQTGTPVLVEISGERTTQPASFWTGNPWPDARPKTAARVAWAIPAVLGTDAAAISPDLASVVQELVDQPGWQAGDDISLLIGPQSGAHMIEWAAYDFWAPHAPQLLIEYESRPVDTATPTPTATATPTETATGTPTPTETPTATETATNAPQHSYLPVILSQ
jgi:hypothetical protein